MNDPSTGPADSRKAGSLVSNLAFYNQSTTKDDIVQPLGYVIKEGKLE